jgi:hypothetical protein
MSDENASNPLPESTPPQTGPGYSPNLAEEFDRARWTIPPARLILIGVAAVALAAGIWALIQKPHPPGGGAIDNIASAEVTGQQQVLVAVTLHLTNTEEKALWVHSLHATLNTGGKEYTDEAASAADHERFYQAFPVLRPNSAPPLKYDDKMLPKQPVRGTIIFSFPVTQDQFNQRQSLSVSIEPFDMRPIVLKQ